MGGGSPILFLLPALAGSYETKERGILPDATCVRQAAQVQVAPCAAGSHCASHHRDADASKFARRVECRGRAHEASAIFPRRTRAVARSGSRDAPQRSNGRSARSRRRARPRPTPSSNAARTREIRARRSASTGILSLIFAFSLL